MLDSDLMEARKRQPDCLAWTAWNNSQHWAFRVREEDGLETLSLVCGAYYNRAGRDAECHDLVVVTCPECARLCGPNRRLEYVRAGLRVEGIGSHAN